jgi:DNA-directed RNA polymerase
MSTKKEKVMNNDEFLQEIEKSINWYKSSGSKATIDRLIDCHDYLATMSFTFAEIVADAKLDYSTKEVQNKAKEIELEEKYREDFAPMLAKKKAAYEMIQEEIEVKALKSYWLLVDLKRQQLNKIIEAIKQRVSYAKKEKELSQYLKNIENKES